MREKITPLSEKVRVVIFKFWKGLFVKKTYPKIINVLEREVLKIFRYEKVFNPDKIDEELRGFLDEDRNIILEANSDRDMEISTLIHEVCHCIWEKESEKMIVELENILWDAFTQKQKDVIAKYIPSKIAGKIYPLNFHQ